ncbi:MAG: hypothetical protein WCO77_01035 [bacterium]
MSKKPNNCVPTSFLRVAALCAVTSCAMFSLAHAVEMTPPTPVQRTGGMFLALISVACMGATPVDVPSSRIVTVDFADTRCPDWQCAVIPGTDGIIGSVADMDTKVMTYDFSGSNIFHPITNPTRGGPNNCGCTNRTIFCAPRDGAAVMRVAVTNKTGSMVGGLNVTCTLRIANADGPADGSLLGYGVYYTTEQSGTTNWMRLGQYAPLADNVGSATNITLRIQPLGGWAADKALSLLWVNAAAEGGDACYAISNMTFSVLSDVSSSVASTLK